MIRAAKIQDARAIAQIHIDAWQTAYRGIVPEELLKRLDIDQRTDRWIKNLQNSQNETYVYESEGVIGAWISFGPERDDGRTGFLEVWALYVSPGKWEQGLGKALMQLVDKSASNSRNTDIVLWVLEQNLPARAFYQKVGYAPDGSTKTIQMGNASLEEMRYHKKI